MLTLCFMAACVAVQAAKKLLDAVGAKAKAGQADYRRFTGHTFSAANPHGKRQEGDKRQFARI